jgi:hypothetical protein
MASTPSSSTPDRAEFAEAPIGRRGRLVDAVRVGFTTLACLMAVTILGTSGDVLAVYNQTHVGQSFQLALWPFDFNLGPTISLVAGSAVIVVSSFVSLAASRASFVCIHRIPSPTGVKGIS